eukprot:scaffold14204_cov87-Cyclotella_meneghiniana.AAC.3
MVVTARTSGGQQLMMRAHRRMSRGRGEWLAEGEGPNPVGCCLITAVEAIRGIHHGCEAIFYSMDANFRDENLHLGRIRPCYLVRNGAFHKIAFPFSTSQ